MQIIDGAEKAEDHSAIAVTPHHSTQSEVRGITCPQTTPKFAVPFGSISVKKRLAGRHMFHGCLLFIMVTQIPSIAFGQDDETLRSLPSEVSLQQARYSPENFALCNMVSDIFRADKRQEVANGQKGPQEPLRLWSNSLDRLANALALSGYDKDFIRKARIYIGQPEIGSTDANKTRIELRLLDVESQFKLLPVDISISSSADLSPRPIEVTRSKRVQTALSYVWLALAEFYSHDLWSTTQHDPTTIRRLGSAKQAALRAVSLVTPWCQRETFILAYIESLDLTYEHSEQSKQFLAASGKYRLEPDRDGSSSHARAIRSLTDQLDKDAVSRVEERVKLSGSRSSRWSNVR